MAESSVVGVCAQCLAPAVFTCSRCRATKYCNAACQRTAWRAHKKQCRGVGGTASLRSLPYPPVPTAEPARMTRMQSLPAPARASIVRALRFYAETGCAPDDVLAATSAAGGRVDLCDGRGSGMLHFAAQKNRVADVERLIKLGADVTAESIIVPTPLHVAALTGALPCMQLLLEAKADPNAISVFNMPSYSIAAMGVGCESMVAPGVVDAVAQQRNSFDHPSYWSPLHWAAISTHPNGAQTVELLLARGAYIDQRGGSEKCGWTPLHFACIMHNEATVKVLVRAGAAVNVVATKYNQTPLLATIGWQFKPYPAGLGGDINNNYRCSRVNIGGGWELWGDAALPQPSERS